MESTFNKAVQERLRTLTPREEKMLRMYWGFGEHSKWSVSEIAAEFDLTRERVRQTIAKALRRLNRLPEIAALLDTQPK